MAILIRFLLILGMLSMELIVHAVAACTVTAISSGDCSITCGFNPTFIGIDSCFDSPTFTVASSGSATEVQFLYSNARQITGPLFPGLSLGRLLLLNTFTSLDASTLEGITGLTTLWINNNPDLSSLPDNFFDGTGSTGTPRGAELQTCELFGNALTNVDGIGLSTLTSLRELYLYSNKIESLNENIFNGLGSLQGLYLFSNKLSALPRDIFSGLVSLEALELNDNQFSALPTDIFRDLVSLQELNLDNNLLSALSNDIFRGLGSLQELYLDNNLLSALPTDIFRDLVSLQILRLNSNLLSALPTDIFRDLVSLQELYLRKNQLSALPTDIFSGLVSLRELRIQGNSISCLSSTLFAPLTSLGALEMTQTLTPRGICAQTFKSQSDLYLGYNVAIDYCATFCSEGTVTGSSLTLTAAVDCDCNSNEGCIMKCESDCSVDAPLGDNMQRGVGCLIGALDTSYCQNQCDDGYGYEAPWTPVPITQCVNRQWMPGTLNNCVENNCLQPAPLGENMIKGTSNCEANTMHGFVCQHYCVTGYAYTVSADPPPITCQLGAWSPRSIDSCNPILCLAAAPIDLGTMTTGSDCGANSAEGTVCQHTCNSGLEYTAGAGDNPPGIECRLGAWSLSSLSSCTAILCRTPAPLADNMVMGLSGCGINSPLDSTCQHNCLNGFLYDGNDKPPLISCTEGSWNPASINPCMITTCVNSAPIDANTMMIGSGCGGNQEHGTVCQQTCNTGLEYTVDAGDHPPAVMCVSGTWSPSTLTACTVKRCKSPAPFDDNMVMGSTNCNIDTPGDSTCRHKCKSGFNYKGADNPPDITCFNGKWNPSLVLPCTVIPCLNAAPIDHNSMDQGSSCTTNQEHGTLCQHTCKDGFEYTSKAANPPPLQCLSGTWSPNTIHPCIAKVCKVPAHFADNMVVGASGCDIDSPEGAICQHRCKNGFVYPNPTMNPPPIRCIRGAWNPATIMACRVTTCVNSAPIDENTMMIGPDCEANQAHATLCKHTCNTGLEYTIDAGDQPPVVECQFGTWSPAILTPCTVKRCKSPAPFAENMIRGDQGCGINTPGGSTCQHSCKTGYYFPEADSPPEITCSNGEWSPATIESCIIYDCGPRPTAANTHQVATTGTTYEETTTYECIGLTYGPYNVTSQTIVCNERGQWTALHACTGGITLVRLTLDTDFSPALADKTSIEYLTLCQSFYSKFLNVIPRKVIRFSCEFRTFREGSLVAALAPIGETPLSLLEETQTYMGIGNSIFSNQYLFDIDVNQPAITVTNMELVRTTQSASGISSEVILDITDACALYNHIEVCQCEERDGMPDCVTSKPTILIILISTIVGIPALILIVNLPRWICGRRARNVEQPIEMREHVPINFMRAPRAYYRPKTLGGMPGPIIGN